MKSCQSNLVIAFDALFQLFCNFINTTTYLSASMNRFGDFLPLLQHFKSFWAILKVLFSIWQNIEPCPAILYVIGQIYNVRKGQVYNLGIWSHCFLQIQAFISC